MKNTQSKYPKKHTSGNVTVRVYNDSTPQKPKYRVRWYGEVRDAKTFHYPAEADAFALAKAVELDNASRPIGKVELAELRRKADLFDRFESIMTPHHWTVDRAVDTCHRLLTEMGDEGLRHFAHIFSPRLAKVRPCKVADVLTQCEKLKDAHDSVSQDHRNNLKRCFRSFEEQFGDRPIHLLTCAELDAWLTGQEHKSSTRDKWLYGLRNVFTFAKDYLKALPQGETTECDLVMRTKSDKAEAEVFSITEIIHIARYLPDRETMLAFALVLFGHLRQEEALKLVQRHFRIDPETRLPSVIVVTAKVAKHKKGQSKPREIVIASNLAKILSVLLPAKGPLFHSEDVYARIRRITEAIGVGWKLNALRHCCSSYAVASGMPKETAAAKSGHTIDVLVRDYLVPVEEAEGMKHWRITFNRARLAKLPAFQKTPLERVKRRASRTNQSDRITSPQMEIPFDDAATDPIAA